MSNYYDEKLICKTCSGKKIIMCEHGNAKICPMCKGTGELLSEKLEKLKKQKLLND